MPMNDTIRKFGHPATLVRDYAHWVVLLRPQQPTAGSLVLAAKSDATAFSELESAAFEELAQVTVDIERALKAAVSYERINYLMLMMVDPHVHFHVIPRYEGERSLAGVSVPDKGWPKVPDLGSAVALEPGEIEALVASLKELWGQS
jgi:diadenosine tetraphosphate (Ap4A) HIT family hydrolase